MRLNNNVPALNAYTSLLGVNKKIDSSMRKLASGYKINTVADDAAGLAIANKMRRQTMGLDMASKNALDGVSLVQTANGAFTEMSSMVIRIRELSVQMSNDTNTPEDRRKADEEVQQLKAELSSMAEKTEFNKIRLLNGDASRITRVKDLATDDITKDIAKATYVSDKLDVSQPGVNGGLQFDVLSVGQPVKIILPTGYPTVDPAQALVGQTFSIGREIIAVGENETAASFTSKIKELTERLGASTAVNGGEVHIYALEEASRLSFIVGGDDDVLAWLGLTRGVQKGVDAELAANPTYNGKPLTAVVEGNHITFTDENNEKIEVDLKTTKYDPATQKVTFADAAGSESASIRVDVLDFGQLRLQVGPNQNMEISIQIPNFSAKSLGLEFGNVKSWNASQELIDACDGALAFIAREQAKLGAYQNRLQYTVASLDNTSENTQSALSRIIDTDMAYEITIMTSQQVIAQAAMSVMGQANQRPQQLLQILS
ncbi:flagellin [Clostridia bacterium]|nr:flagellin [Clostridia bacterium]